MTTLENSKWIETESIPETWKVAEILVGYAGRLEGFEFYNFENGELRHFNTGMKVSERGYPPSHLCLLPALLDEFKQ